MSTTLTTETARSSCSHHPLFTCNKCGGKNARRKHKLDRRGSAQLASPISPNSRSYSPASHAYSPASSPDDAPDAASPVTATARSGSPKSLKEFALDLFVSSHPLIWKGQGTQFPMLSWVIEARKSPDNGPTLQHACEALSLMAFAKAQNRPDIRQLAIETYQDAMQKVFNILQASETGLRPQCETLMAVFVLTVYEYISDTNQGENHFLFHMCGLRALLVTCDLTTFATTTYGRDFLSLVLIQNFLTSAFVSKDLPTINHPDGWSVVLDETPKSELYQCMLRICWLRSKTKEIQMRVEAISTHHVIEELQTMMNECRDLQQHLHWWSTTAFVDDYTPRRRYTKFIVTPENVKDLGVWPGELISYDRQDACTLHALYLITQLIVCVTYLRCQFLLNPIKDVHAFWPASDECFRGLLLQYVNEISAVIPYAIGVTNTVLPEDQQGVPADAFAGGCAMFFWAPLLYGISTEGIPQLQRDWFVGRLKYIGTHCGISIATMWTQMLAFAEPLLISGSHDWLLGALSELPGFDILHSQIPGC